MESLRSSASAGPLRFATPGSVPPTPRKSTRPRCPQCGTRRFRRDPSTSLVVCAQGHVLQGFRDEEAQDGDDWQVSTGKRAIKKIKRLKRSKASKAAKGGTLLLCKASLMSIELTVCDSQFGTVIEVPLECGSAFSCCSGGRLQLCEKSGPTCQMRSR